MSLLQSVRARAESASKFIRTYGQHLPHAFRAVFQVTCDVIVVRGATRATGEDATIVYAGRRRNFPFLMQHVFKRHDIVDRCATTLLRYRHHMDRFAADSDAVFVDVGWPYLRSLRRSGEFLEIPDWIGMAVDLAPSWDEVVARFRHTARNNDLRLIRRNDYKCSPTRSQAAIASFYDEMYLPFIRSRHDADAVTEPRRNVLRRAASGWLLRVQANGETIVAGVVYPDDGVLYFLWMGVAPAHLAAVPEGAISALYYFGIRHAFDEGMAAVDFTGTRAFLDDGPYRFKRKWGALVEDTFSPSAVQLRPSGNGAGAMRFCAGLPVLVREGAHLDARFVSTAEIVDQSTFGTLEKRYSCPGIDSITVVHVADDDRVDVYPNEQGRCRFRHVRCRQEQFARRYVQSYEGLPRGA